MSAYQIHQTVNMKLTRCLIRAAAVEQRAGHCARCRPGWGLIASLIFLPKVSWEEISATKPQGITLDIGPLCSANEILPSAGRTWWLTLWKSVFVQATADVKGQEKVTERGGERVEMGEGCCIQKPCISHKKKEIRQKKMVLPFNNSKVNLFSFSSAYMSTFSGIW